MKKDFNYYINLPYKAEIEFEPKEGVWIASHPELGKGSCYAIADTPEEAIAQLKDDKKELLEILFKEGKSIPEPKFEKEEELPSGQFILRIPRTLHKRIKDQADIEGVSLNHFLSSLIAENFSQKEQLSKLPDLISATLEKQLSKLSITSVTTYQGIIPKTSFSLKHLNEIPEENFVKFGEYNGYQN